MKKYTRDDTEHGSEYYLAIEVDKALAKLAQEPDHGNDLTIAYMSGVHRGKELAAQQRPWVGLTHQETKDCMELWDGNDAYVLCRAIEAKLKELNT
jgi:hypothetical protein